MRRLFRLISWLFVLIVLAFLVLGYFMPFEDREGRCAVCGMRIYEKTSPWLREPVTFTRESALHRFYLEAGLPDHEHQWEYMGGVTYTNFFSIPGRYEFERSDPLLLVPDEFMIEVLRRLELRDAQIELLRGLNCDDEAVREDVRAELYAHFPGGIGSFMTWWEEYISAREGIVPCSALPGPPWEHRVQEAAPEQPEFPTSDAGNGEPVVDDEEELDAGAEEPAR